MAGRILRPLSGLVDHLNTSSERKVAIAQSAKPSALIIDFAGNSGRHKLVTSADILGGSVSEKAIELAVRKARESGKPVRMDEELDECEEEIRRQELEKDERHKRMEERKSFLVARVKYSSQAIDPFRAFDIRPHRERGWDFGKRLSEKQRALLLKVGIDGDKMPYAHARQLVTEQIRRWKNGLCTYKQARCLQKYGYETRDLTMVAASKLLDALAQNGWRKVG